ncbi:GNAT family N-acetyltransferase [Micromonospora sp. NPDC000207]|uniref:GNAT family N-acetyltransferase n=1 Tax=Micromonospora sp. NPDC000207 TaxID=3154246 RepID=UPI003327E8B4
MTPPEVPPADGPIEVRELSAGHDVELLHQGYAEILLPSFPPDQLESVDVLDEGVASGTTHVGVAVADDRLLGMAVADSFDGVLLLSYVAARPGLRGGGVGSALLTGLLPRWRDRIGAEVVLAEVEDPRRHPVGEFGDPRARLRFYQRLGFGLLPFPFFQPRIRPESRRQHGMLLMVQTTGVPVRASLVRTFVTEYFAGAEGETVDEDPEYAALLALLDRQPAESTPLGVEDLHTVPLLAPTGEAAERTG